MVIEVGELDEEEEFLHLDFVLTAVEGDGLAVEGFGYANGGAARSENIVEEGDIEGVAFGNTGGDVAETVVDVVAAVLFLDGNIVEVAFVVGELAFLAYGDDRLHQFGLGEQRCRKEESAGFDGGHIGVMSMCVDVGNELVESLFVLKKGQYINKIYPLLGEVGIVVDNVEIVHSV